MVNSWSNVHCVNNSFGLYTPQSQFMSLGTGPLGINLNDGYLQSITYVPARNSRQQQQEEARSKKLEDLIEEKAILGVKAGFFEKRSRELEENIEELKKMLEKVNDENHSHMNRINTLSIRLKQWEDGTADCKNNMGNEQNKASVALQVSASHISQLEKDNAVYMDTNKQLTQTIARLKTLNDNIKASSVRCTGQLSECNANLATCENSEREATQSLEQLEQNLKQFAEAAEGEYTDIHNQLQEARVETAQCTASLAATKDRNVVLQKDRDYYISRSSKENTLLNQCRDDLQSCHANHSLSTSTTEKCRNELDKWSLRFSHKQEQYMKCTSDLTEINMELRRLNDKNTELNVEQANKNSRLENMTFINTKLENRLSELVKLYDTAETQQNKMQNDIHSCQVELKAMRVKDIAQNNELVNAKLSIDDLHSFKTGCMEKREDLAKEAAVLIIRLKNMEKKASLYQKQAKQVQAENDRILSNSTSCKGELLALQKLYAVVLSQKDHCLTQHNRSVQATDDWQDQYLKCNGEIRNLTTALMRCETENKLVGEMRRELEQEAEVSVHLIENLSLRLRNATNSIAELTKTIENMETDTNLLQTEKTEITKELEEKNIAYLRLNQQYTECSNGLKQSLERIKELQEDEQFGSEVSDSIKEQMKHTSDKLVEAKKTISHQEMLVQQERNRILELQTELKAAQELHGNELERRKDINEQLKNCRQNHTETQGESQKWQSRLETCREHIGQLIDTHEKQLLEVEATLRNVTEANENVADSNIQLNATLQDCKRQQGSLESSNKYLQNKEKECRRNVYIQFTKMQQIIRIQTSYKNGLLSCRKEKENTNGCRKCYEVDLNIAR